MRATSTEEEPPSSLRSFLGEILAEQQRLQTPVARFSGAHDGGRPSLAGVYRDLIPLSAPGPGEQYAFEVELDSCTGCKACVSACHSLNGLDEGETWRDTGLLASADPARPFAQTVTTACHHCADPACLNGCPVLAYEKDPATGIVRHLDDQCIGCSYCIFKCPYDAPKYNPSRGIVRKCDLCHGRLEHGEAPACVQACPTHAIRVTIVPAHPAPNPSADTSAFLSGAPDPAYTLPTTRYLSKRGLPPGLVPAEATPRPEPAHWPLVVALTFIPLAVGSSAAAALLSVGGSASGLVRGLAALAWMAGTAGIAASIFHLGQPLRAWRVFLGLRRSWLSRETVLFALWWVAAATAWGARGPASPGYLCAAALGAAALFCSVMVYADTPRELWRLRKTAPRFFGSALILGLAAVLTFGPASRACALGVAALLAVRLAWESRAARGGRSLPERQAARLLAGPLALACRLRIAAAALGGVLVLLAGAWAPPPWAMRIALPAVFLGELADRYLFFRAVDAPRMPGIHPS